MSEPLLQVEHLKNTIPSGAVGSARHNNSSKQWTTSRLR